MKFLSLALVFVVVLFSTFSAHAAKQEVDKSIFAGKLKTSDITLTSSEGEVVVYSSVKARLTKKGKVVGSALRYDSISGETVAIKITGGIKGRPKMKGSGRKAYALVKGTVVFSDGATGKAEFASRDFKQSRRFPALAMNFERGFFAEILLLLLDQFFSGWFFFSA